MADQWDAQKMLDMYIHDYMVKKNMNKTAEIFAREADVVSKEVAINPPDGFLVEWWSMFWDVFSSRYPMPFENGEESSAKVAEATRDVPPNFAPLPPRPPQMSEQAFGTMLQTLFPMMPRPEFNQQTMSVMQTPVLPNPAMNQQMFAQLPVRPNVDMLQGQEVSTLLAKMYEQECIRGSARDLAANFQNLDVDKMNTMLASSSRSRYLQQQNPVNIQQVLGRDAGRGNNLESSNPVVSTPQGATQAILTVPKTEIPDSGMNKGIQQIPVSGQPSDGVFLLSPRLGHQVLNPFVSVPSQLQQIPTSGGHCQHLLPELAAQKSGMVSSTFRSSPNLETPMLVDEIPCGKALQQKMPGETQNNFLGKKAEKQPTGEQIVLRKQQNLKLKEQNSSEVGQGPNMTHNGKKRKKASNSLAVASALDEKDAKMDNPMDEDIVKYFSFENENADDVGIPFSTFQQNSSVCNRSEPKGFSFKEVGSLHSSNNQLLCCHFSSLGNLLGGAGHEKKVLIWNMENLSVNAVEGHCDIITDIRFRPNSTVFATSSFDKTVLIWDASKPSKSLFKLIGHTGPVLSLDFHPKKVDLLCSCDDDDIRMWNIDSCACTHISKVASRQVRFQPQFGDLLAAASGNIINLIDVETKRINFQLKGHVKYVSSFCWDTSGKYIASVSEDRARIWSISSGGKCTHELHCGGNKFESCTFHPGYSQVLVIGSYKSLQLWNPTECNKTWSYPAHDGIIAALADSPNTRTIASASHDQWVKLWK